MTTPKLLTELQDLPRPADADRARVGLARLREQLAEDATLRARIDALEARPPGAALLAALFGNSPFLGQCIIADPAGFFALLDHGPEARFATLMAGLRLDDPALGTRLRQAKRAVALLVAVADIGGLWPLERITGALSEFAERALHLATGKLLAEAAARGELVLPDPADPCTGSGLAILGMGKLGARELNYSSDIDLIVLFDETVVDYRGPRSAQECLVRITRDLVTLMQERTADGYVFRTDLRLRPDAGATAVALSMGSAELYYESQGQNWERAAMIKARSVAGDIAAGARFLKHLTPFVWRKNLDFAAIADIHSIKRQIHAHKGHGDAVVPGHDVKLGRGGIREIEFFAQTQQLIAGGRDPRLREITTVGAIGALAATGRIDRSVADDLIDAYRFLRELEHRLQMVDDQQTHQVPADPEALRQIAVFMGFADTDAFSAGLLAVLHRVQGHYAALFEQGAPLGAEGSLVFTGTEDDPETLKTLAGLGFVEPPMVAATVRRWHHGRYAAMRSARARELLTELTPRLLAALGKTPKPDEAFLRFDEFLGRLPAGVQLFSLFMAEPELLDLMAEIMGAAPRLAGVLARRPQLFDAVLDNGFYQPPSDVAGLIAELTAALVRASDYQDELDIARRFVAEREFQVGVQVLRGRLDVDSAARGLSAVADAALGAMLDAASREFSRQHGTLPGGGMVVVGLGKLGAGEMIFGSDLDLIFIYEHAPDATASDGPSPLAPSTYFARLSHRVINALTALTGEGRLYEVDMRLRPSGNAGPVAVSLASFVRYQNEEAWTWEHMALTRGRVIAGSPDLRARTKAALRHILLRQRDEAKLFADVEDMHRRTVAQHADTNPWNIKHAKGGLLDAEFIAQALVLRHAPAHPEVLTGNTALAFDRLGTAGLLPAADARSLADAARLLRTAQMILRLCHAGGDVTPALRALVATAWGMSDPARLEDRLAAVESGVAAHYLHLVGAPGTEYLERRN